MDRPGDTAMSVDRATLRDRRSLPVADADLVRVRVAGAGLDELLQAHQVRAPPRAAVGHELHGLAPAFVPEEHDRVVVLLLEVEDDVGADPLLGPAGHLPFDPLLRPLIEHLHVEAAWR